ncbi:unnamed protein product, partial [marine sediment metagenome]
ELEEDYQPFTTEIESSMGVMNADGRDITFSFITGDVVGTPATLYFCVGKDGVDFHCDEIDDDNSDNKVTINPISHLSSAQKQVGTYYIKYYSIDANNNIEEPKQTEFFLDPLPPEMPLNLKERSDSIKEEINLSLSTSECAICTIDKFKNLSSSKELDVVDYKVGSSEFLDKEFHKNFSITFENLGEGTSYRLTITCNDTHNNSQTRTYEFTAFPLIKLYPEIPDDIYTKYYDISGITTHSSRVIVYVEHDGTTVEYDNDYTSSGLAPGSLIGEFTNQELGMIKGDFGVYPQKGKDNFKIAGDLTGTLHVDKYLQFSDQDGELLLPPRYKITHINQFTKFTFIQMTNITVHTPFKYTMGADHTVSAYTTQYPEGWFSVPNVEFQPGENTVTVVVIEPLKFSTISMTVVYTKFNITLKNPTNGSIVGPTGQISFLNNPLYPDIDNSTTIKIQTNRPASCELINEEETKIAKAFIYNMDASLGDTIHLKTISEGNCTKSGGDFCCINNYAAKPAGVY